MNIYGASGHGKVIWDILKSQAIAVDNIFDDNPEVKTFMESKVVHEPADNMLEIPTILAIGNNTIRKKVARRFTGRIADAVKHNTAILSESIQLGAGTVVMPGAVINADTTIGKHCIVNSGAVIEHDVQVADFVHISPNAVVTGNVSIGEGTQIGTGVAVIPGIKIGKWATIGAGAVIVEDIPDFAVVVGNPGKIIKYSNE